MKSKGKKTPRNKQTPRSPRVNGARRQVLAPTQQHNALLHTCSPPDTETTLMNYFLLQSHAPLYYVLIYVLFEESSLLVSAPLRGF